MTQPDDVTIDQPDRGSPHGADTVAPADSFALLASILDRFMTDIQAGRAVDRGQLWRRIPSWPGSSMRVWRASSSSTARPAPPPKRRRLLANFGSSASSAAAVWGSSTRPSRPPRAGTWP